MGGTMGTAKTYGKRDIYIEPSRATFGALLPGLLSCSAVCAGKKAFYSSMGEAVLRLRSSQQHLELGES